tara:strand:- start:526 stop:1434 length:909 start_codon:yes stop_codon:yes gene_type:complete
MRREHLQAAARANANLLKKQANAEKVSSVGALGAVARGVGSTALKAGKGIARYGATPGGALGLGLGYLTLAPESINPAPILKWHMTDKETKAKRNKARADQSSIRHQGLSSRVDSAGYAKNPTNMQGKMASVRGDLMFTEDEVRAVQRISSVLMEKTAAPKVRIPNKEFLTRLALYGTAGLAIGGGSQLAAYGINKSISKASMRNKSKYYNSMLKADPSLKREPGARQMFDVMHRASPYLASEPVIAAATVRSMMDSPVLDERRIQSLLSTEKARQETEFPWARGGGAGTQVLKDMASVGIQ